MISLSQELMDGNTDKLCFVLAHELVHCFRYLTVVVPAFLDWPTFRDTTDCNPDEWLSIANLLQQFVDHYGGANELAEVKCYWPDDLAERWFRAMCS